jgi:LPXTG-motif cell wall-anchored protein
MSILSALRSRTAALIAMLALIGAALLSVPALAGATPTPYPPNNPSSGAVASTSAHQNQPSSTSSSQHGTNDAGTASTGFQTLTATAIAAALLIGGVAFVVVGRRRRHG